MEFAAPSVSRAVATTHMMRARHTSAQLHSSADLPKAMQNLPAAMPRKWRVLKFLKVMLIRFSRSAGTPGRPSCLRLLSRFRKRIFSQSICPQRIQTIYLIGMF